MCAITHECNSFQSSNFVQHRHNKIERGRSKKNRLDVKVFTFCGINIGNNQLQAFPIYVRMAADRGGGNVQTER